MTLAEAATKKIRYVRLPQWNPYAHLQLDLSEIDGRMQYAPWAKLFDPPSMLAMGRASDDFDKMPTFAILNNDFEEWTAPLDMARFIN